MMTDIFFVKNLFIPILKSYICPAYHKPSIINIPYKHLLILNKTLMNKTLRNLALVALVAAPVSAFAEIQGAGTAADPYKIATADDLCNAHKLAVAGSTVYFVQTADIDMTGVTEYNPLVGYANGGYDVIISYDGNNHVIKNFAPTVPAWSEVSGLGKQCYSGSVFGVANGTIANLGVIDAKCVSNHGTGIIAAYGGHSTGSALTLENVYVTGEVNGTGKYAGGMLGTTGNDVTMKNCFANVKLTSTDAETNYNAGLIGRVGNNVELTNVYVAGEVPTGKNAGLATAQAGNIVVDGVVIFNNGPEVVFSGAKSVEGEFTMANTAADKADGLAEVKDWAAFSATETIDGYPALEYTLSGEGTEANPYIIDGQTALCNAYRFVDGVNGGTYYFKQTADVDMAGVDLYHPIAGWNGSYQAIIHYDGQNHVIKNFAPVEPEKNDEKDAVNYPYYSGSIFGVPQGSIKNLGVINAACEMKLQGAGILGSYGAHNIAGLDVENVFVDGVVSGAGNYTGGMFGTTGGKGTVTLTNCFANVDIESGKAAQTAGIIGRLRNNVEMTNVYVAGTVPAGEYLVAASDQTPSIIADAVIAFNTGATEALSAGIVLEGEVEVANDDTKADLIEEVKGWTAFSATKELAGYPILKAFEAYGVEAGQSGIFDAAVEEGADAPAVYYNLQGVQVANPENGVYIVRRGSKVTKELIRK